MTLLFDHTSCSGRAALAVQAWSGMAQRPASAFKRPGVCLRVCVQVDDAGLYRDLLQHWGQEALQGCSSKALVGALHAASVFTAAQSDWVQSGSLPTQPWQHLLAACVQRWGRLSAEERRSVARAVQNLCGALRGVVSEGLLLEVAEMLESGGTS